MFPPAERDHQVANEECASTAPNVPRPSTARPPHVHRPSTARPPPRPRWARLFAPRPPVVPPAPRLWRWPLRFGRLPRAARWAGAPPAGGAVAVRWPCGGRSVRWPSTSVNHPCYICKPCYICNTQPCYICKPPLSIAGVNPLAAAVAIAVRRGGNRFASRCLRPRARSRPPAMPRAPTRPARPWRLPVRLPVALLTT